MKWNLKEIQRTKIEYKKKILLDLAGGPAVKTSVSLEGGAGLIPGWERSSHVLCDAGKKKIIFFKKKE